jgi:hypothetical protein
VSTLSTLSALSTAGTEDAAGTAGTALTAGAGATAGSTGTGQGRTTVAALPAGTAVTASAREEPAGTTGTTGTTAATGATTRSTDSACSARGARSTGTTGTAMAHEEPAGTTGTTGATGPTGDNGRSAGTTGTADTGQPPTPAAGTTDTAGTARAATPAVTDQACRPTSTTSIARSRAVTTGAAAAQQPSACPTGRPLHARGPIRAVTDQRTSRSRRERPIERSTRRTDRSFHHLRRVGSLGAYIRSPAGRHVAGELVMERRCLCEQPLILLPILGEQRTDRRRHLIGGRAHHPGRRNSRRRTGAGQVRADAVEICSQPLDDGGVNEKRRAHGIPPSRSSPALRKGIMRDCIRATESERTACRSVIEIDSITLEMVGFMNWIWSDL